MREPLAQALHQLLDRLRLVARGRVVGFELEGSRFHALRVRAWVSICGVARDVRGCSGLNPLI